MRKLMLIVLCVSVSLCSFTTVYAAVPMLDKLYPDTVTVKDGDTHIGTFLSSDLPEGNAREFLIEWLNVMDGSQSPQNDCIYLLSVEKAGGQLETYSFIRAPRATNYDIVNSSTGVPKYHLFFFFNNGASKDFYAKLTYYFEFDNFTYTSGGSSGFIGFDNIICCSDADYFANMYYTAAHAFQTEKHGCDWVGNLILNFDDGINGGSGGEGGGNWFDGILDFIRNFWDKLLDFIISIFVPSDDFFSKWYDDIRNAVSSKLGGIFSLYEILKNFASSLTSSAESGNPSLIFSVSPGAMFYGSPGVSVDIFRYVLPLVSFLRGIFTAIIVLYTGITCYKRIVEIFES